jgi:hypothetical protein
MMLKRPDLWLYDKFVRFLDPQDYDPEQGLIRGLSTNLAHSRKAGVKMRIGAGSGVLLTNDRVLVASDVTPSRKPAADVEWRSLADLTSYRMGTDILLSPPPPPFLFVAFGKKPDIRATLRTSVSRDIIEFCGDGAMTIRRRHVIAAYDELDGVPLAVYRTLTGLVHRRTRDPMAQGVRAAIAKIIDKQGEMAQRALAVAERGPQRNTPEYHALSRLLTARDKAKGDAK